MGPAGLQPRHSSFRYLLILPAQPAQELRLLVHRPRAVSGVAPPGPADVTSFRCGLDRRRVTEMYRVLAPRLAMARPEPAPRCEMGELLLTTSHQPSVFPDARGCPSTVCCSNSSAVPQPASLTLLSLRHGLALTGSWCPADLNVN